MALSRKRQKELNRLKTQATNLWDDQKEILENASKVVRDARRQAANYAREEVSPRVKDAYEDRVRPAFSSGAAGARAVASSTREKLVDDVLPAVASALSSAMAVLEVAKNRQVREALARVGKAGTAAGNRLGLVESRKGPGRYILIGIAVVAVAGVAYAAWQTLRADDDLWIAADEESPVTP